MWGDLLSFIQQTVIIEVCAENESHLVKGYVIGGIVHDILSYMDAKRNLVVWLLRRVCYQKTKKSIMRCKFVIYTKGIAAVICYSLSVLYVFFLWVSLSLKT